MRKLFAFLALAVATVAFGQRQLISTNNLSDVASSATARTNLGLAIGTNVQAFDADLTTWAGITPAANIGTFLGAPSSANLLAAMTDKTGTGLLVFGTAPTFASTVTVGTVGGMSGTLNLLGTTSGTASLTAGATGSVTLASAAGSNINLNVGTTASDVVAFNGTLDASSTTAAAVTIPGGLAVAKRLFVGTGIDLIGTGTLVSGITSTNGSAINSLDRKTTSDIAETRYLTNGVSKFWTGLDNNTTNDYIIYGITPNFYSLRVDGTTGESTVGGDLFTAANTKLKRVSQIYLMGDSLSSATYAAKILALRGTPWNVINRATSGNTSAQMLARFTTDIVTPGDANTVIVWGGINDPFAGVPAATIESNLQAMYTAASNAGYTVVAVKISPCKNSTSYSGAIQTIIDDVNTWISATAIDVDYIVDAYTLLEDPGAPDALLAAYDSGDHIHLTTAGYELVATTINSTVTWTVTSTQPTISASGSAIGLNQNLRRSDSPGFAAMTVDGAITVGTTATIAGAVTIAGNITATSTGNHVFGTTNTVRLSGGNVTATGTGSFGASVTIEGANPLGELASTGTGSAFHQYYSNGDTKYAYVGLENASGGFLLSGSGAYGLVMNAGTGNVYIGATNTLAATFAPTAATFAGTITAGTGPTTLTDSAGKILSAALNTVGVSQGGTGATTLTGSLIGNGTSAVTAATSSTVGQVYRVTGANTFAFGALDLADTDAVTGVLPVANFATGTPNGSKFVRDDGVLATPGGSGTVTATGGSLTANAVVLGAGTTDTKVSTGITTDGTAGLVLGVNTTTLGSVKLFGNTSGDVTVKPAAVAGTATVFQLPASNGSNLQFLQTNGSGVTTWADPSGSGDMVLASVQTVTGAKTFGTIGGAVGKLVLAGSTSGSSILNAAATAGTTTLTLQGTTGTIYSSGGTDVAVVDGGTGLSSGTDGGILGFTATGTLASSVALGAGNLVVGGGVGATPTSVTAGATTTILVGGGAGTAPVWTTATGSDAPVRATSPTLVTPTLGVASATSLATSAATPLLLTNGQLVNIALTSQTVGATTLTIPDFASVVDEFTFKTKAQTMSNKTFVAPDLGTPSAGVVTNLTGTASININGTVGGTTPAAGTFTTLVAGSTTSLLLGTAGSAVGNVGFRNATSGTATVAPPTGALGTYTVTLPNAASTLPIFGQQITFTGPTAARSIALPDAAFTVARTDAANTFTGASTAAAWVLTSPTITTGIEPTSDDGAALGTTTKRFSDLFLAEGGVINFDNGDATITQVGDVVTLAGADLKITTPGTAATSVATIDGTQNLTNKTISTGSVVPVTIGIACSDETTAITAAAGKATFRIPHAMTLTAVRASVGTAPTGATILIDINETGTTVLSTKLMIDASEKTSTTATTAYVISDSALADDAEITIDFDQVGSTIAGAGVKVWLIGTRTL